MPPHEQFPDDELDRLLHQAQWPAPRADQVDRLSRHWRRLHAARRRRIGYGAVAMAAGLLLLAAVLSWRHSGPAPEVLVSGNHVQEKKPPVAPAPAQAPEPAHTTEPSHSAEWAARSRAPNLYEQVILMSLADKPAASRPAPHPAELKQLTDELVAELAADAAADVEKRLTPLERELARCERLLWMVARREDGQRRLGAARLLARIGTPRSAPVLLELAADPATHEAAVPGLARLADDAQLAQLVAVEPAADLRGQLLHMLLARRTPTAVARYLGFVHDPVSRSEALAVLADAQDPPAELLLAHLENPSRAVRLAAALALSRLTDPAVVEELCHSIAGIGRQEAIIALLLSSSEEAAGCLSRARGNLYLVASVQAAEQQLHLLQTSRGGLP